MVLAKEEVELNETAPNELIGEHTVYRSYGSFVFMNGKLETTKDNADKLRKDNIIK